MMINLLPNSAKRVHRVAIYRAANIDASPLTRDNYPNSLTPWL
jgi:hypothetical protein